jgi:hypothetical protein
VKLITPPLPEICEMAGEAALGVALASAMVSVAVRTGALLAASRARHE